MPEFLRSKAAITATALIFLQAVLLYGALRPEAIPPAQALAGMPAVLGSWDLLREGLMDKETLDVLKADDVLNRMYHRDNKVAANLFVAAFRSQRDGKAPHSPKNCLPGSGWVPLNSGVISIDPGTGQPIQVNRYIVAQGDNRSLVLYWYQSRDRVVASEYAAKFWVVVDAMRLNRTDTALVRVVVPIANRDDAAAQQTAEDFVRAFYGKLREYLPA